MRHKTVQAASWRTHCQARSDARSDRLTNEQDDSEVTYSAAHDRRRTRMRRGSSAMGLLLAALAAACGSSGPADPPGEAPTITISGVAEGSTYSEPVTIAISTDRGTYQATLDGAEFVSGRTVSSAGS